MQNGSESEPNVVHHTQTEDYLLALVSGATDIEGDEIISYEMTRDVNPVSRGPELGMTEFGQESSLTVSVATASGLEIEARIPHSHPIHDKVELVSSTDDPELVGNDDSDDDDETLTARIEEAE